ncbi:MAG TPA: DUF5924 family protein [Nitrososphaera sp.]|nr:DUF5924 family protein [Nitrososphaera sp.]
MFTAYNLIIVLITIKSLITIMNFGRRQVKSIVGMAFAVLGGVAWFFQLYIPAAMLWGAAMVIVFSLNKRKKQGQRR